MSTLFDGGTGQAREARKTLQGVKLPSEAELRIQLQQLVQQGELTPMEAETILQQKTAYSAIEEDPRLRGSQVDALSEFEGIVDAGGLDARSRAGIYDIEQELGTQARGAREALAADARARGLGNSDLLLVQQMIADQGAATRGADAGVHQAALAEERRGQALRDQATLAGGLREADYRRSSDEAAAVDAINRFNTAQRQSVIDRNVANQNIARATNLGERQRVADANVGLKNQQEMYNKRVPLEAANLRLQKAGGVANAFGREGAADAARDDRLLQLIGGGAQAAAMAFSDPDVKEDVSPIDSARVLEELSGVKYQHRDPEKHGAGERMSVMADDMERVQPSAVTEDAEGTKMIDYGQLMGFLMGNLVDVSDRLREVEGRG